MPRRMATLWVWGLRRQKPSYAYRKYRYSAAFRFGRLTQAQGSRSGNIYTQEVAVQRNPELKRAMQEYVAAALAYLEPRFTEASLRRYAMFDWVRSDGEGYQRRPSNRFAYDMFIRSYRDELHTLPEYSRLDHAVRADGEVDAQLDTLLGTLLGRGRYERVTFTDGLINELLSRSGTFKFDITFFSESFDTLESDLRANHLQQVRVSPLLGLRSHEFSLDLGNGASIGEMSEQEIAYCLDAGLLPRQGSMDDFAFVPFRCCIRQTSKLPKIVGERELTEAERDLSGSVGVRQINVVEEVLETLRLFRGGTITTPGFLSYGAGWLMRGGRSVGYRNAGSHPLSSYYQLSSGDEAPLRSMWDEVTSADAQKSGAFRVGARRFSLALERERPDDRVVDLMIAAEALFLTDQKGSRKDFGEKTYRLALRAAFFLANDPERRRGLFKDFRDAYWARSSIVHGAEPSAIDLPPGTSDLIQLAQQTEDHMRLALQKALKVVRGTDPIVNWEGLIVGLGGTEVDQT